MTKIEMLKIEVEVDNQKKEMGKAWITLTTPEGTAKVFEHDHIGDCLAHAGTVITKILLSSMLRSADEEDGGNEHVPNTNLVGNA